MSDSYPPKGMPQWLHDSLIPIIEKQPRIQFIWWWKSWLFGVSWQQRFEVRFGPLGISFRRRASSLGAHR